MRLSKRELPWSTCFPPGTPVPSSTVPLLWFLWHPHPGTQSWTRSRPRMLVPSSPLFPPNYYSSSTLWASALRQSSGICWCVDHRRWEPRRSLRNMDRGKLISTLPHNCWWLLELSDKSDDNSPPSLAQRWFRKHILIEGKAIISNVGYGVPHYLMVIWQKIKNELDRQE